MEDVQALPISSNSRSPRLFRVDLASQREHGRTFGPIFGLFLMNLLKAVTAKYDPLAPFQLVYNSDPWVAYENKQLASYQPSNSEWYPVENPFHPSYQQYQPLTTAKPFSPSQHISSGPDYSNAHHYYNNYNYEDYNQVDQLIASASNDVKKLPSVTSTIPPSTFTYKVEEPIPAESRYPIQKYKKRPPTRRPSFQKQKQKPKKKRTTTTPHPEYYDSYEDYVPPKRKPSQHSSESYYYDSEDDDVDESDIYDDYSYETTTKRFKNKRKKRPTRKATKPLPTTPPPLPLPSRAPLQVETTTPFSPSVFTGPTEIVIVRQAAPMTTTTTTTDATTTTTEPDTIITNTTAPPQTTTTPTTNASNGLNNATYGYGPSNGNENISFTYGPPIGKYQYSVPSFDWYSQEATRNAIVKRVRDIVTFDKTFPFK